MYQNQAQMQSQVHSPAPVSPVSSLEPKPSSQELDEKTMNKNCKKIKKKTDFFSIKIILVLFITFIFYKKSGGVYIFGRFLKCPSLCRVRRRKTAVLLKYKFSKYFIFRLYGLRAFNRQIVTI